MADFEAAKAFMQTKEDGVSLYDHLTEVLLKVITEQPKDGVQQFERISAAVKAASMLDHEPTKGAAAAASALGARGAAEGAEVREAAVARLASAGGVFKIPGEDDEAGEVGEGLQDVADAANYLEWAGVGLSRTEMFRLGLALRELSAKTQARDMRVWGKLQGLNGDYIVAEGKIDAPEDEVEDEKDGLGNAVEPTGTGANTCSYWVCAYAGAEWTRLPRVTPHQVVAARQIKRFFTGDLAAPVSGHPPFPGQEASFVRAQIARITAETAVCPAGHLRRVEDEDSRDVEPTPDDEYAAEDASTAEGWVHVALPINRIGRTAPNPKDEDAEEGAEEEEEEGLLTDPLKPIADDAPPDSEDALPWTVRVCPVSGIPSAEPGAGLVLAKSLLWPGAVCVARGRRFANFYTGYGVEAGTPAAANRAPAAFQPATPGPVQAEFSLEVFNAAAVEGGAKFEEQADVVEDPDAGKPAEEGEGEEDDE
jgi:radial spoke head protein 4A